MEVNITERGWAGHFVCAHFCRFRRNTLVQSGETRVVVSTVGAEEINGRREKIGSGRYYETMAFHAEYSDGFWDSDVQREYDFSSPCAISEKYADAEANDMHEAVVREIAAELGSREQP